MLGLGFGTSIVFFFLTFAITVFYIHRLAPLHDRGWCRWFWFGYWPLNIVCTLAIANLGAVICMYLFRR